ncbi:MAG TPA: BTAD domain-containing putative transcriptional regulator, partial [Kribbellaceae bacterium]
MGDLGDVTTIDWHSFGSRLRRSRQRLGITQDELARRSGVSVRTLRHLELGQVAEPRADSLRRLTAVLGLTIPRSRTDDAAPGNALRISVLGPLQVASVRSPRRTEELRIGPAMPRNLLGLLALHPNRTVSREEIVDVLWPDDPPRTHVNLVHTYIARIRKAFKPGRPGKESIVASRGGYLLDVDENHLDLLRFDEFTSAARALPDTESRRKLDLYAAALACWRGPVLADVSASVRQQHAAVDVARRRVEAAIGYADLALRLGLHDRVAGELRGLVPAEPLHEGLHARLML